MTADMPEDVAEAFGTHDSFEQSGDEFVLSTTVFDATARSVPSEGRSETYEITVHVPTLDTATTEAVGSALEESWQETLTRRLEEATKATRASVELDAFDVEAAGEELRIEYRFTWGKPERAADIAKTFIEYVEGSYVEGIVPGYEYEPPVSSLLSDASQSGNGGTPL